MFQRLDMRMPRVLHDFIDTDYVENLNQRKSVMGYVFMVAEYTVSWKTKLQDTEALSITEVEYIAPVEVSKEALWLRRLIEIFSIMQDSVRVHCNNQSIIHLAKDHMYHNRT